MSVKPSAGIATVVMLLASGFALATSPRADTGVSATNAWVPLAPPNIKVHAGYFDLTNSSSTPRYLVGVTSPVYQDVEIHVSRVIDDVATMEHLAQVEIAPGKTVVFKPGGLHVMLMGPKSKQSVGEEIELTLIFQNGEQLKTRAKVTAAKQMKGDHSHHGHGTHKQKGM